MSAIHVCDETTGRNVQNNDPAVTPAREALGYLAAQHEDVIRAMLPVCAVTLIENADPAVSLRLCASVTDGGLFGTHRARRGCAVYATGGVRDGADLELELRGVSDPRQPIGVDLNEIPSNLDRDAIESLFRRCTAFEDVAGSPLALVVLGKAIVDRYLGAHGDLPALLSVCATVAREYACAVAIECPALPGVSGPAVHTSLENASPLLHDPNLAAFARVATPAPATLANWSHNGRRILHVTWAVHRAEAPGCYRSPSDFLCFLNTNKFPERWPLERQRRFVYSVKEFYTRAEPDRSEIFGAGAETVRLDNSPLYDKRTFLQRFFDRF